MNSKAFRADIGHSQVQACLQSFQLGGFLGPFVDVGDFYTTQQVPGVEELETYRQETDFAGIVALLLACV